MSFDNTPKAFGVMARVQPPTNPDNDDEVRAYRTALAKRHLRCELSRGRNGLWSQKNICSLWEVLYHISPAQGDDNHAERSRAQAFHKILDSLDDLMPVRGQPQLTERQINNYMAGITQAQFDCITQAIAASDYPLLEYTAGESWVHLCDRGVDEHLARDSTVHSRRWEVAAGMHTDATTRLIISGEGDIAALDTALCMAVATAAVEQTLLDIGPDGRQGRYAYQADDSGCYAIHVFHPEDVEPVCELLRAHGFTVCSQKTLPLSAEQEQRLSRQQSRLQPAQA